MKFDVLDLFAGLVSIIEGYVSFHNIQYKVDGWFDWFVLLIIVSYWLGWYFLWGK